MSQHYRFQYCCDMSGRKTYRQVVRELALDNYGFVTTRAARMAGVPAGELPKLAARGGLVNVAYGLYRVPDIPPTIFDQFAEALLRVGDEAYLHGESVLALHDLADVNPRQVRVAVNRRARPSLPPFVSLTWVKNKVCTTHYEGLPSQPVADAILECRDRIETSRLLHAAGQARAEGLLTTRELNLVLQSLQTGSMTVR